MEVPKELDPQLLGMTSEVLDQTADALVKQYGIHLDLARAFILDDAIVLLTLSMISESEELKHMTAGIQAAKLRHLGLAIGISNTDLLGIIKYVRETVKGLIKTHHDHREFEEVAGGVKERMPWETSDERH